MAGIVFGTLGMIMGSIGALLGSLSTCTIMIDRIADIASNLIECCFVGIPYY